MEFLNTTEAARILKMDPRVFTRWLEEGRVPGALKLGRQWRVTPEDIKALLKPVTLEDLGEALKPAEPKRVTLEDLGEALKPADLEGKTKEQKE